MSSLSKPGKEIAMRRFISLTAVALVVWASTVDARGLTNLNYNIPGAGKSIVDSIPFRSAGTPTNICTLIGAAIRDTTMGLTPLAGLKTWAVHWLVTNAAGPSTSSTWALNCTLEVSLDSVNWEPITVGTNAIWAITSSTDQTQYQAVYSAAHSDTSVGVASGHDLNRMITTARYGRFKFKVANSADDTVYVVGIQSRTYDK